jgi:hypothetical protein
MYFLLIHLFLFFLLLLLLLVNQFDYFLLKATTVPYIAKKKLGWNAPVMGLRAWVVSSSLFGSSFFYIAVSSRKQDSRKNKHE